MRCLREPLGLIRPAMDARQDRARYEAEADRERLALGLEPARRFGQGLLPPLVV